MIHLEKSSVEDQRSHQLVQRGLKISFHQRIYQICGLSMLPTFITRLIRLHSLYVIVYNVKSSLEEAQIQLLFFLNLSIICIRTSIIHFLFLASLHYLCHLMQKIILYRYFSKAHLSCVLVCLCDRVRVHVCVFVHV